MKQYIFKLRHIFPLLAVICTGMTACMNDPSQCVEDQPEYTEGNDVRISFDLKSVVPMSRAAAYGESRANDEYSHPAEDATPAECAIKPADLSIVLFDDNGNAIKAFGGADITLTRIDVNTGVYTVQVSVNHAYFDYADGDDIEMSLLVIANEHGVNTDASFPVGDEIWMKSAEWFSNQLYSFSFPAGLWMPDGSTSFIPMGGLKHFSVSRSALEASTADNPCMLGSSDPLLMQRSIAKVRIFDNIPAEMQMSITGVTITGVNNRGAFMPDFNVAPAWANGTVMVEKASVKSEWLDATAEITAKKLSAGEECSGDYTDAEGHTFAEAFVAYMPESILASSASYPALHISCEFETGETKVWDFNLYDIISEKGIDITRNHIYEFTVTASPNCELSLSYTVCSWFTPTIDIPNFE